MAFTPFVETDQPTMANFNEKFQEVIQAAIDGGTQVSTGSYVGTGEYGSSNPNKLNFGFKPKILIVGVGPFPGSSDANLRGLLILVASLGGLYFWPESHGSNPATVSGVVSSVNGTEISWYNTAASDYQANRLNQNYPYVAIG